MYARVDEDTCIRLPKCKQAHVEGATNTEMKSSLDGGTRRTVKVRGESEDEPEGEPEDCGSSPARSPNEPREAMSSSAGATAARDAPEEGVSSTVTARRDEETGSGARKCSERAIRPPSRVEDRTPNPGADANLGGPGCSGPGELVEEPDAADGSCDDSSDWWYEPDAAYGSYDDSRDWWKTEALELDCRQPEDRPREPSRPRGELPKELQVDGGASRPARGAVAARRDGEAGEDARLCSEGGLRPPSRAEGPKGPPNPGAAANLEGPGCSGPGKSVRQDSGAGGDGRDGQDRPPGTVWNQFQHILQVRSSIASTAYQLAKAREVEAFVNFLRQQRVSDAKIDRAYKLVQKAQVY